MSLDQNRTVFLTLLDRRVSDRLYQRLHSIANGRHMSDHVVWAFVEASRRILLTRLRETRCKIHVRFGHSHRISSKRYIYIEARFPGGQPLQIHSWGSFIEETLNFVQAIIQTHGNPGLASQISFKIIRDAILDMVGPEAFRKREREIKLMLESEERRADIEGDEDKAIEKFCSENRESHLQKFRNWVHGHVNEKVISRDDFMAVYDELLVKYVDDC